MIFSIAHFHFFQRERDGQKDDRRTDRPKPFKESQDKTQTKRHGSWAKNSNSMHEKEKEKGEETKSQRDKN